MAGQNGKSGVEASLRLAQEAEEGSRVFSGKTALFVRWFAIIMSIFQLYTGFFWRTPRVQAT